MKSLRGSNHSLTERANDVCITKRTVTMYRLIRTPLLLLTSLAMAACADPASLAMSGASVVTAVDSGKTVSDHAMSFLTGDDCSFLNSLRGGAWCQPILADPPPPPNQVCYKSIAAMTCYPVENPHETASRRTF